MARLNKKSTKNEFVKELKSLEQIMSEANHDADSHLVQERAAFAQVRIVALAKELEIEIKPEEYK